MLFVAAFFGNLFYSLSLLTNPLAWSDFEPYGGGGIAGPNGSKKAEWWANTLPFFLGASGVLCQDALVYMQYVWWGDEETTEEDLLTTSPVKPKETGRIFGIAKSGGSKESQRLLGDIPATGAVYGAL